MSGTFPLGPEATPNWPAGYVPSAAEWSMWWSNKLDHDDAVLSGGPWLSLSGGTMTGPLNLHAMPVNPDEAATKAYVDQFTPVAGPFLSLSGGTMTGVLTLAVTPTGAMDAVTKSYADGIGSTSSNALAIAQAALPRTGGTMTGPLILGGDPVNPLASATKQYVDRFVPLWGATMSGTLATSSGADLYSGRNIYATNAFYANSYNGWEWAFVVDAATGSKFQSYRSSWYDEWNGTNGDRTWNSPGGSLMTLTGGGTLFVINGMNLGGSGIVYTAYGTHRFAFGWNGNINCYIDNSYQGDVAMAAWVTNTFFTKGGGTITGSVGVQGSLGVNGNISSGGTISGVNLQLMDTGYYLGGGGSGRIHQYAPNWYWDWTAASGEMSWMANGLRMWSQRRSDNLAWNDGGAVGGYGAYQILSDERAKRDIEPAGVGLAEVMGIRPIKFQRIPKGDAPSRTEIGFSAQQLRSVIPDAVSVLGIELPDGDSDSLGMTAEPIIAALVNAVQELAQRLAAVENK